MEVIDVLNTKEKQKFEEEKNLNPIKIRIEKDRVQNILEKYKENAGRFKLEGLLISSGIKTKLMKYFWLQQKLQMQNIS